MGILVGDLRYKLEVIKPTLTKNSYGEAIETWSNLHTLRAARKYLGGSKGIDNSETFTSDTLEFTTHYRKDITPIMRIVFAGNTYTINNIQEIGFKDGLKITAEKINE